MSEIDVLRFVLEGKVRIIAESHFRRWLRDEPEYILPLDQKKEVV